MTKDNKYTYAVGRRKEAAVRVRVMKGKDVSTMNGKPASVYFPGELNKILMERPLKITGTIDKYYFTAKSIGGGKHAQLEALVLGISKALIKIDKEGFRTTLKKDGLLTRDARIRERRKVNTGGKARRQKQSPKR
jgi:small subunit ribosomal protein S9